jgi:hypothetical protein
MAGLVSRTVLSQTLSERVRASGPYRTEVVVDYPAPDFRGLVVSADVIVVGTIGPSRPVISPSGRSLETEYDISIGEVVTDKTARKIQAGRVVIVRRLGGQTTIDGHEVSIVEPDFPFFKEGERYVLLLKYAGENPNPMLEYGGQSAFKINADTSVRQASLTHGWWTRERDPVALDGFLREVREVIGRNR